MIMNHETYSQDKRWCCEQAGWAGGNRHHEIWSIAHSLFLELYSVRWSGVPSGPHDHVPGSPWQYFLIQVPSQTCQGCWHIVPCWVAQSHTWFHPCCWCSALCWVLSKSLAGIGGVGKKSQIIIQAGLKGRGCYLYINHIYIYILDQHSLSLNLEK